MNSDIVIAVDDLSDGAVVQLLNAHRQEMLKHSPPQNVHALEFGDMQVPNLTFWSARIDDDVIACGALKMLDDVHAELKSMKVSEGFIGNGVGRGMLGYLLEYSRVQRYERISLETGAADAFKPARTLYQSAGFNVCSEFGDYAADEHSVFMTLEL